jgi:hypothetical protein
MSKIEHLQAKTKHSLSLAAANSELEVRKMQLNKKENSEAESALKAIHAIPENLERAAGAGKNEAVIFAWPGGVNYLPDLRRPANQQSAEALVLAFCDQFYSDFGPKIKSYRFYEPANSCSTIHEWAIVLSW